MLTGLGDWAMKVGVIAVSTMSEEQLLALLAKLKEDTGLQEKLKGAADIDAAIAMAQEAGFDVSKADGFVLQPNQAPVLSDSDLEIVAGGWQGGDCVKTAEQSNLAGVFCSSNQAFC